jgi:hypothetical protein
MSEWVAGITVAPYEVTSNFRWRGCNVSAGIAPEKTQPAPVWNRLMRGRASHIQAREF